MKLSHRVITEFHAHIYFQEATKASAEKLYQVLGEVFGDKITRNSIAYATRGPHVPPMFGIDIPKTVFPEVLDFLILNHGPHAVLIHPVSGNELLDHTHHALWLGDKQPLNLAILA